MRQIDVDLIFSDDEPAFFVSEDGTMKWAVGDVISLDWKDHEGQSKAIQELSTRGDETVILFDGSDSMIYVNMSKAQITG